MRKNQIKEMIERSLWKDQKMPTGEEVKERVRNLPDLILPAHTTLAPDPLVGDYTERVQSFFPECKLFDCKYSS